MRITVLGSGVCVPLPDRGNSGYALLIEDSLILLDSGSGTMRNLAKSGYDQKSINTICYSHFHPDHIHDLTALIFGLIYDDSRHNPLRIRVVAPIGFKEYFKQLQNVYHHWIDNPEILLDITECAETKIDINRIEIKTFLTNHTENSIAFRITDRNGKSLVYTGDTDYSDELSTFCKHADLVLAECSHSNNYNSPGHLNPEKIVKLFNKVQPENMLLSHFYEDIKFPELIKYLEEQGIDTSRIYLAMEQVTYTI